MADPQAEVTTNIATDMRLERRLLCHTAVTLVLLALLVVTAATLL
ncbi:hypothetical protein [Mycolicibacterium murale]|nr:hypothetical protein [Mycolicibacterium murale]